MFGGTEVPTSAMAGLPCFWFRPLSHTTGSNVSTFHLFAIVLLITTVQPCLEGQGDLVSRLIIRINEVTMRAIGVKNPLTKPPQTSTLNNT